MSGLADLQQAIRSCRSCDLSVQNGVTPVPLHGPPSPDVVVIGEAPGAHENDQGRPFCGPAGRQARRWLTDIDLDPEALGWLNVVSCYPCRTPTTAEVFSCRPNFVAQIEHWRPLAGLVLGSVALNSFWAGLKISSARGLWWRQPVGTHTMWMLATYHPAFVLRQPSYNSLVHKDLSIFRLGLQPISEALTPISPARCALCGQDAKPRWRSMPFCQSCKPADVILEEAFPNSEWLERAILST